MTGVGNDFTHVGLGSPNITSLVSQVAGLSTIAGISPNSGPVTGGTAVTITGTNFIGVSSVQFGNTPALSFQIDSSTQITVVTPPCLPGSACYQDSTSYGASITVVTPAGHGFSPPSADFVYEAVISNVSPNSGPMEGGTVVTVTGIGFSLGYNAPFYFGGVHAVNAQCQSTTQCTMASPAASAPGTVDVRYGESPTSATDWFTYQGPMVTNVFPAVGKEIGGDNVIVTGTSFGSGMTIKFGSTQVTSYSCSGDTCFVSTPPGKGAVHVTVTVNGRTSAQTSADVFTYEPLPYGTISPSSGPGTGGTIITVIGANFSTAPGATVFTFDFGFSMTANATNVNCSSTNVCTMVSPPLNPKGAGVIALVSATVTWPCSLIVKGGICVGGTSLTGPIADYTYTSYPYPQGTVSPNWGLPAGGTVITVTGSQLTSPLGPTKFTFTFAGSGGSAPATNVNCSSSTVCTITSPALNPNASGPVANVIASVNGFANSMGTFTYGTAAPPPPPPPPPPKPLPPPKCHGICQ
jgi:hypothetical protein